MALFKQLVPFTVQQAASAADQLQAGIPVAVRIDPRPMFIVFLSSAKRGLPYEVDFLCTSNVQPGTTILPAPLTRQQAERLKRWVGPATALIIKAWRERHPFEVQ